MRKLSLVVTVVLLAIVVAAVGRSQLSADDAKKPEAKGDDCYKLVAPLGAIMKVTGGIFTKMPEKAQAGKYKEAKSEALFLAEVANLSTHDKDFHDKPEYKAFAEAMKTSALKLADAADKKDEAAFKTQYAAVEKACDSCHEKFRDN